MLALPSCVASPSMDEQFEMAYRSLTLITDLQEYLHTRIKHTDDSEHRKKRPRASWPKSLHALLLLTSAVPVRRSMCAPRASRDHVARCAAPANGRTA
jgi:hypothetical protein